MSKYKGIVSALVIAIAVIIVIGSWQGICSFLFAWVFNLMLMMSVLSIMQTFQLQLSSSYFHAKPWEKEGKIYKWVGINGCRTVLVWVGWEKYNKASNPIKRDLAALTHLEYSTRQSEFGHLVIFFIVLALALFIGSFYGVKQALWLHLLNVLLNVYPIGVQRYNRPRFQKAIKTLKALYKDTQQQLSIER